MRKYIFGVLLAMAIAIPAMADDSAMLKDFVVGDYTASVKPSGTVAIDYKGSRVLQTMPFVVCGSKWEYLYNAASAKPAVEVKKDGASKTVISFKDDKSDIAKLQETITLSPGVVEIEYSYELPKDVPHLEPIMLLPENTYSGVAYSAVMAGEKTKTGILPVDKSADTVYRYDGLTALQTLHADTKAGPVDFTFTGGNWSLGDHRNVAWAKSFSFWSKSIDKAGKWSMKVSVKMGGK
jgi:hypothetical protein